MRPGHCASLIYTSGTTGPPKVCGGEAKHEGRRKREEKINVKGMREF